MWRDWVLLSEVENFFFFHLALGMTSGEGGGAGGVDGRQMAPDYFGGLDNWLSFSLTFFLLTCCVWDSGEFEILLWRPFCLSLAGLFYQM